MLLHMAFSSGPALQLTQPSLQETQVLSKYR